MADQRRGRRRRRLDELKNMPSADYDIAALSAQYGVSLALPLKSWRSNFGVLWFFSLERNFLFPLFLSLCLFPLLLLHFVSRFFCLGCDERIYQYF